MDLTLILQEKDAMKIEILNFLIINHIPILDHQNVGRSDISNSAPEAEIPLFLNNDYIYLTKGIIMVENKWNL